MCALDSIWDDAYSQHDAFHIVDTWKKTECLIFKGFKIESENNSIYIYKPKGDYYEEINSEEYDLVYHYGWRKGVLKLVLKMYQDKLDRISELTKIELNTRRNDSHLKSLRTKRQGVMSSYLKVVTQISKL